MRERKVLITGGAGFIGRCLASKCLAKGWDVSLYDNLSFGRESNIEEFKEQIHFYMGDVLDYSELQFVINREKVDLIYHLAAYHYIPFCNDHPMETIQVNTGGTDVVMRAAISCSVGQVILASTGALYRSVEIPLDEDVEDVAPVDIYGISKKFAEEICKLYAKNNPIHCLAGRFFNTYGPYETNPHLIPHIINSLKTNGSEIPLGNLNTKRDYIYVDDLADALINMSQCKVDEFDVFNIGTGYQYSACEIVEIISKILNKKIEIFQEDQRIRQTDKPFQRASIEKISKTFGWNPAYSLEDGLRALLLHEGLI